jgi:uncharacterized membrane protein
MITFENNIVIDHPIHDTFAFVADFENTPLWNYYVRNVTQLTDGPIGIGTVFHQVRKSDEQEYRIIEFECDRGIVIQTTSESTPAFSIQYEFEPVGDHATRLTNTWQLDLGVNPIIERLSKQKVASAVSENLGKLKELLETGAVVLHDNRRIVLQH